MFDQARSLELAIVNSESYSSPPFSVNAAVPPTATEHQEQTDPGMLATVGSPGVGSNASSCFFCGNSNHPRSKCPARMRFALIVRKGGTLQKFAVEGISARTKFQLQPGLLHSQQTGH